MYLSTRATAGVTASSHFNPSEATSGRSLADFSQINDSVEIPNIHFIVLFNSLQLFGLVSLSAVLVTAWLSSQIRRASTWFSFVLSWIVSCTSYLLVFGNQTGPEPSAALCLAQATLTYGAPVLTALAGVAFCASDSSYLNSDAQVGLTISFSSHCLASYNTILCVYGRPDPSICYGIPISCNRSKGCIWNVLPSVLVARVFAFSYLPGFNVLKITFSAGT
ncbi:hypothetical protein B0H34DRAFT_172649 [Crassisporium funariophilum]|nr:hypothetical protein B0H34DRAFT_172649 [Crassisporium funariophilum]